MSLAPELEAQILRYYHVERWRAGTIARQLHVHHGTVERVLAQAGLPALGSVQRSAQIDGYLPFIHQTLLKFPSLTAARVYAMVRERGYRGGPDHFRHLLARHRPRKVPEAYLRLTTLSGEQGQVDWGHFGHFCVGRARRPLMAFVMVLSWSRQIFLHFCLDARMESFLRGHVAAFTAWNGLPRVLLYDNLKSAVLERQGDAIRFHPTLLNFAGHYRFEPRPVAIARGNEKGRVERAIRYVREGFFAARAFTDIDDLNAQALQWCLGQAADRLCPADHTLRVGAAFAQEQATLLPLPSTAYPTDENVLVKVGKTPYVRFDRNDYSVPHTHVQRALTVCAEPHRVRVLLGTEVLATHPRSYDCGAQIEDPTHIAALVDRKRQAHQHRGANRLSHAVPASEALLLQAAERGTHLGAMTRELLLLLDQYGASELHTAIQTALRRGVPHQNAVRLALEQQRAARHTPVPLGVNLPAHVKQKDTPIQPHKLAHYDQLTRTDSATESATNSAVDSPPTDATTETPDDTTGNP